MVLFFPMTKTCEERFREKAVKGNAHESCWQWTGATLSNGYGQMWHTGKARYAHRIAYEMFVGVIPSDLQVCHSCDNPSCVNPSHLFLGTQADNERDKGAKGRQARGSSHGNSKLTEVEVASIRVARAGGVTCKELGQRYGVDPSTIGHAARGKNWGHLD